MNKKITVIVIALLISLLSGCFPTGEFEQESSATVINADDSAASEQSVFTVPNDLTKVKFNFDLSEIDGDYPSEVPTIKVKKQIFDVDKMKALFLDGKTIIDDYSDEYDFRSFTTAEGETLVIEKGRVDYSVDHYYDDPEKNAVFEKQISCVNDLHLYYSDYHHLDSELDGVSRTETLAWADELVKSLDIKYLREPNIYAFTAEDCNAVYSKREGWYFDENYEFYLVRYNAEYNDIPIAEETTKLFHNELAMHIPTRVDILIGKDGLIEFSCYNVFDSVEAVEQTQIKCDIKSAVTKFYEEYAVKDSILDYTLEYDKIGLAYNTIESDYDKGEIVFKPLWQMSGTQYITTGHTNADKLLDPETGLIYNNYP